MQLRLSQHRLSQPQCKRMEMSVLAERNAIGYALLEMRRECVRERVAQSAYTHVACFTLVSSSCRASRATDSAPRHSLSTGTSACVIPNAQFIIFVLGAYISVTIIISPAAIASRCGASELTRSVSDQRREPPSLVAIAAHSSVRWRHPRFASGAARPALRPSSSLLPPSPRAVARAS